MAYPGAIYVFLFFGCLLHRFIHMYGTDLTFHNTISSLSRIKHCTAEVCDAQFFWCRVWCFRCIVWWVMLWWMNVPNNERIFAVVARKLTTRIWFSVVWGVTKQSNEVTENRVTRKNFDRSKILRSFKNM